MNTEMMFGFIIFLLVALVMVIIGIAQCKSKSPVGFYTGEQPPAEDELTDWKAWNKKHGIMWILFGIVMMLGYCAGAVMGDTIYSAIPMCGGVIAPLPFMIWNHHRLIKKYRKEEH